IFYNRRCKVEINENVGAMAVRKILLKSGVDFDLDYVIVNDKLIESELIEKKELYPILGYIPQPIFDCQYPDNFPKYNNSGDPKKYKENYIIAKQKWIEDNPDAYKVMTGVEYLDYSFDLNKKNK
ncbi:MAG: hypothetical protein V2A54_04835, partial [Bacteroidota bacterium]